MLMRAWRPECRMRPDEMKSYRIIAPYETHFRPATCEEVNCPRYFGLWKVVCDVGTIIGLARAKYLAYQAGRKFEIHREIGSNIVEFIFPPGQRCFEQHRVRIDRPEHFVVADGDWRGNPRGTQPRIHTRAADWVDDFANHQDRLITLLQRG
jgi:hypothetical protein